MKRLANYVRENCYTIYVFLSKLTVCCFGKCVAITIQNAFILKSALKVHCTTDFLTFNNLVCIGCQPFVGHQPCTSWFNSEKIHQCLLSIQFKLYSFRSSCASRFSLINYEYFNYLFMSENVHNVKQIVWKLATL